MHMIFPKVVLYSLMLPNNMFSNSKYQPVVFLVNKNIVLSDHYEELSIMLALTMF